MQTNYSILTLYKEKCYKCGVEVLVTHVYPDDDESKQTGFQVDIMTEDFDTQFFGYVCMECSDKIPNSSLGYPPWSITIYPNSKE